MESTEKASDAAALTRQESADNSLTGQDSDNHLVGNASHQNKRALDDSIIKLIQMRELEYQNASSSALGPPKEADQHTRLAIQEQQHQADLHIDEESRQQQADLFSPEVLLREMAESPSSNGNEATIWGGFNGDSSVGEGNPSSSANSNSNATSTDNGSSAAMV